MKYISIFSLLLIIVYMPLSYASTHLLNTYQIQSNGDIIWHSGAHPKRLELLPSQHKNIPKEWSYIERNTQEILTLTPQVIIGFNQEANSNLIAEVEEKLNAKLIRFLSFGTGYYLFQLSNIQSASSVWDKISGIQKQAEISLVTPNWKRARKSKNDPLYSNQWHLENTGQISGVVDADIDIEPVWQQNIKGNNVTIGVIDDGLEISHEDLVATSSRPSIQHQDYLENDNDPTRGEHGTSVAGIISAEHNNLGVRGIAPNANLVGLALLGANSDFNEAHSLSYESNIIDITNNSWGPFDDADTVDPLPSLVETALQEATSNGRNGLGTIFVWAGGNGGSDYDNSNYDGYANSRFTIAVAASNSSGTKSWYSEEGANILVNAPSSGNGVGITTTDRTGGTGYSSSNYTHTFGGTSAATPVVSGVIALILETNPQLTWRDIQAILIESAEHNDPTDNDWQQNSAGFFVNHKYGFGRINAESAIRLAQQWSSLPQEQHSQTYTTSPQMAIPDTGALGSSNFVNEHLTIESIEVELTSDHTRWGDLKVTLTSPSGTKSILAQPNPNGSGAAYSTGWKFTSNRHYKEASHGTWGLNLEDTQSGHSGSLINWKITIHGHNGSNSTLAPIPNGDLAPLGNRDGTINAADALIALQYSLGLLTTPLSNDDITHGDVAPFSESMNTPLPNGHINIADSLIILRKALGIISF